MADIEAAFNANAGLVLVDALQTDTNGVALACVAAWKLLPINHHEVFALVRNLETAIPQEHRGNLEPLRNLICEAVTSVGAAVPAFALYTGWFCLDHSATPGLESWYYAL
jgi:hypothetical protein